MAVPVNEIGDSGIRQHRAVSQRQSLNSFALGKRDNRSIIDPGAQGREIQPLHHIIRIATQFVAHLWQTIMQFSMSVGELSFAKIAIKSSGGSREIGGSTISWPASTRRSRRVPTPTDDCESLGWLKKSVSSSITLSGEVDEEDSEAAPRDCRK
ncbi:hypothetical protein CIHG_09242 [Coccidioides immitis H538.4]|uniref:Uncharacterized protein n=1 Tax=Coccidioides immitis H538.4 TaxID=396776 RepID=A0A0J8S257_COCIT|nr:hypothetical protein CIHG_09242 [Coccidioides immitis H538.4]